MISEENNELACKEVNRLCNKKGWPYLVEGQAELVRVAKKYARDIAHLNAAITQLSEDLDHCPDARELKRELRGASADYPEWKGFTRDDSGSIV